jgi:DNA polymerase-3 subunit chi
VTEIDFYTQVEDRLQVTCQLIHKARAKNLRVLVLLANESALKKLDERLWTFQPQSFIPHCRADDPLASETPVILMSDPNTTVPHDELMINLQSEPPAQFSRFSRLIEIVSTADADKAKARERFRFYRDRGYVLRTHDLSQTTQNKGPAS